ncbi:alpha/beta hydrolase [Oceanobacillus rekensis]|uniref:alpha/beta hydrolase n=1 Tax=Oceanobacillus rekensis TaxID=937927 RepID=UPI000B436BE0|nr:alpha/beta fold hydrolase [Oceanobacillus rekensis]
MQYNYPVIRGAEQFHIKRGDTGVLISHGFMGSPQSMRYIGQKLANYGYSVLAPRLEGHGTHYFDLENCNHQQWFESLERGYQELKQHCTTIFVMGQSMGGTLALWLAEKYQDMEGVILINPALTIPTYENLKGEIGPRFLDEGMPDIKAKDVHETTYSKVPIRAIHELQALMEETPQRLHAINSPILCLKSKVDHVVPPENTDYIIENIRSEEKQSVVLKNSYHVASMDNDKDQIVKSCHDFVQSQVRLKVRIS